MDAADLRLLKIKTGSLNRLKKELGLYKQEEEQERQKVARMKSENADYHDIKHAENVLEEATRMIPDTRQRLEGALQDLSNFMSGLKEEAASAEELATAKEAASAAQLALQ
ncbi:tubulin binding cofactor A [Coccomyxa subellipsoidea C-169]|uniref:Tubulin-specific chaperone A n=1 Tax=Coccomyxa subellipsoidea (strain C-169) TaxID=574566 RepID=I0YUR7_COCSC|nr:tubulin binding cofactor A [Coccomyxa subellipsoidea C-169]EIE22136.1 tubulin binding cofactor A [Coccomyxa subellipsoidea C-169]|eukprot:XP_005646680.1 tubulin binding cofactor A [Coccomyxa subellipsoidea C-169]